MSQSRREAMRRQQEAQARAKRMQRIVMIGAIVAALVVVAVFGAVWAGTWRNDATSQAGGGVPPNATAAKDGIVTNPGKAQQNAPVVSLYLDYQCPICKQFEGIFGGVLKDMATKGEIQLQFHTMTFLDNNLRNDSSSKAAVGAACADNAGKYPEYHDAVFAGQPATEGAGYTTEQLRVTFPRAAGITGDKLTAFQQCYDTRATANFVNGVNELASEAGVTATPTLMVNGKKLELNTLPMQNPEGLRQLILGQ